MNDSGSFYSINAWYIFGICCFVYLFFNWYLQSQVLTDQVYTYSLGRQISAEKLAAFLDGQHRVSLLGYLSVLFIFLLKMILVTFCLYAGLVLTSQQLPFATIFKIVLFAESAFVAGTLLRLLILAFSHEVESLGQYMSLAPLSLYSLFKPGSIPAWLTYPLQSLDLFLVAYVFLLAKGLQFYLKRSFPQMFRLVLGSYGLGLAATMIAFVFISISFNP